MKLTCPVCGNSINVNKNHIDKIISCDLCNSSLFIFKKEKKVAALPFSLNVNETPEIPFDISYDDFEEDF